MARLRLFAALREAAGLASTEIDAEDIGTLLEVARSRFGEVFARSLPFANVAVNGILISALQGEATVIGPQDEVALLPPVSGG
ncbi:MAG: MoaD/ThiS family protein [Actinomycetota bacterium]|nr:MoaD/ThiS family protein [Actinomycetota bacterium]